MWSTEVAEVAVTVPSELYIGAAYEVMPNLKIMAAYSFEHWTVYKSDTLVGDDGFMAVVPRNYNNASVIRLAGEWQHTPFVSNNLRMVSAAGRQARQVDAEVREPEELAELAVLAESILRSGTDALDDFGFNGTEKRFFLGIHFRVLTLAKQRSTGS